MGAVKPQSRSHLAPLTQSDVAQTVLAADLHRKFDALGVEFRVREDAGKVVERRTPGPPWF
jgi:hypothetical protein